MSLTESAQAVQTLCGQDGHAISWSAPYVSRDSPTFPRERPQPIRTDLASTSTRHSRVRDTRPSLSSHAGALYDCRSRPSISDNCILLFIFVFIFISLTFSLFLSVASSSLGTLAYLFASCVDARERYHSGKTSEQFVIRTSHRYQTALSSSLDRYLSAST